jgi:hypothetical protein
MVEKLGVRNKLEVVIHMTLLNWCVGHVLMFQGHRYV